MFEFSGMRAYLQWRADGRGAPPAATQPPDDYDRDGCSEILFDDHDILLLYDEQIDGVEDPETELNQQFRIGDIRPPTGSPPSTANHLASEAAPPADDRQECSAASRRVLPACGAHAARYLWIYRRQPTPLVRIHEDALGLRPMEQAWWASVESQTKHGGGGSSAGQRAVVTLP